jgi:hypothetical protein
MRSESELELKQEQRKTSRLGNIAMRRFIIFGSVFGIALSIATQAMAQIAGRYYSETGHLLDSRFVEYYDSHGGLEILGFPITESFEDPVTGMLIQYLENARLEFAAELVEGGASINLAQLGVIMGGWIPIGSNPGCRYYPESAHQVCHAFLDYYETRGGPPLFGFPITEFRLENDRIVQYFQGFRLDWFPERLSERVLVAPLGAEHFDLMGYDRSLLDPEPPSDMLEYRVLELRPRSSVWKPLVSSDDMQQIYLVVTDQNLVPVQGAAVLVTAYLPTGLRMQLMPMTNENGITALDLPIEDQTPGTKVTLEYVIVYRDLSVITTDSFYIWW